MEKTRIGIIGVGSMGGHHFNLLHKGEIAGATVTAVCDTNPERLAWARERGLPADRCYADRDAFFEQAPVDGILVATPHYDHPSLAIRGFQRGLHVLCEKPAGVYTRQVRQMNEAAAASGKIFALMFNQRTLKTHQKMREMIAEGELGDLRRVNWIITNWFRTQAYYNNGGWRATWAGEGGGVLVNQCPHQLDLLQWICGMPKRIRAQCYFGKYHQIEVEDDVTAFMEFENGATGVFITSTGEAPGTNRFEICGDRGKLVLEHGKLMFHRNRQDMDVFIRESKEMFKGPECWNIELAGGDGEQHKGIIQNWVDAIRKGTPLLAPGQEGIRGVEIANAMLLSAWTGDWAALPVDEEQFLARLQEKIAASTYKKPVAAGKAADLAGSF